jgi:hypothetical protein
VSWKADISVIRKDLVIVNTPFVRAKKRERLKCRKEGGKRGRATQSFKATERMACLLDACCCCRRRRANETIIDFLQLVEKRVFHKFCQFEYSFSSLFAAIYFFEKHCDAKNTQTGTTEA